jgi:hypothetical protein
MVSIDAFGSPTGRNVILGAATIFASVEEQK